MTCVIDDIAVRAVFESRGDSTVEVDLRLADGSIGRGSAPRAIAPGRLECPRADVDGLGRAALAGIEQVVRQRLCFRHFDNLAGFDAALAEIGELRANAALALSIAFARATAAARGQALYDYLGDQANIAPHRVPLPLINVISGGIHLPGGSLPVQQVMLVPRTTDLIDAITAARAVFSRLEGSSEYADAPRLSASSGLVIPGLTLCAALDMVSDAIAGEQAADKLALGFDVAAEHLLGDDGRYAFGTARFNADELRDQLIALAGIYPLAYIEDPFDPADQPAWRALTSALRGRLEVIGDDLFATNAARIDENLATGILLKLDQIGTLSGAISAAQTARRRGMTLCQSHRSGETEDTVMCDFAFAVGARFIKVGGPRRGDRLAKYNQLIRLAEAEQKRQSDAYQPRRGEGDIRNDQGTTIQRVAAGA